MPLGLACNAAAVCAPSYEPLHMWYAAADPHLRPIEGASDGKAAARF